MDRNKGGSGRRQAAVRRRLAVPGLDSFFFSSEVAAVLPSPFARLRFKAVIKSTTFAGEGAAFAGCAV